MPRTDLRHLPLPQQVAAVRRYAILRGRDPQGDPFVTPTDIAKKFRTICPLALYRAYEGDCIAREAAFRAQAAQTVLADIQGNTALLGPYHGAVRDFADDLTRAGWLTRHDKRYTRNTSDSAIYTFGAHPATPVSALFPTTAASVPTAAHIPLPLPLAAPPGDYTEIILREDLGLARGEHYRALDKLRAARRLRAYTRNYSRTTFLGDEALTTYILAYGDVTPFLPRVTLLP